VRLRLRLDAAVAALALSLAALIPGPAAPAPATALTADQTALVSQASAYLDGIVAVKGRFVQTDPRGQVSTGVLYLKRPGYARFAYDPPSNMLVISDGRNVTIVDPRLKTTDRYPLGSTPLALVLARHVRLDQGVAISRVTQSGDSFSLTARDARHPGAGQITLTFRAHPLALSEWTMTDAEGQTTRIRLTTLSPVSGLSPSLFTPPSYYDRRPVGPPPPD
jgi:outer membrane lipoprotein-sorting protein